MNDGIGLGMFEAMSELPDVWIPPDFIPVLACDVQDANEVRYVPASKLDALKHDLERHIEIAATEATRAEAAERQLSEARQDAERYRWLRDNLAPEDGDEDVIKWAAFLRDPVVQTSDSSGDWLDSAVDAAIDSAKSRDATSEKQK